MEGSFKKDVVAGAILLLFGVVVALLSLSYEIGSLRRMGPGYFPLLLGLLLCGVALLIIGEGLGKYWQSRQRSETEGRSSNVLEIGWHDMRALSLPLVAVLLFALLLERAGLIPAVFAAVIVAGCAERRNSLAVNLVLATLSTLFIAAIFVYGLGLPLQLVII